MNSVRAIAIASLVAVTACEGFKEAMTAHVDVAARAGSQELSVEHLATLMGNSQVPLRPDVAQSIADLWVNYQLLGKAAAADDSLKDDKVIDEAMWPVYSQTKSQKWYNIISAQWAPDTTNLEAKYNEGELLSARHILFPVPAGQAATGSDSVRRKAESVLKNVTTANFAAMAKQYGTDATKDKGGDLGLFRPTDMVPEFTQAVIALKPGQIGPLVKTQFGWHIVRRNTWDEVKDAFSQQYATIAKQKMESTYVAGVEQAANIQIRPTAARVVKEVAASPDDHKTDRTVVATSVMGDFTAAQVARWIASSPQPDAVRAQIQQAADSVMPIFLRNLIRNDLFLRQADSAHVALDSSEVNSIRNAFRSLVTTAWSGLHIAPKMLADSAKTASERERLASSRIDAYLERLLAQQDQFVEIPSPLANALHAKYGGKVNQNGLARAIEAAEKIRAASDSTRQPPSAVPMPKAPGDTSRGSGE